MFKEPGRGMCLCSRTMAALSSAVRKGANNIIEANGEHVTSVRRPDAAHQARMRAGTIRPATEDEFQKLKAFTQ